MIFAVFDPSPLTL